MLAITAYGLTRQNLIDGREDAALKTVVFNANQVNTRIVEDITPEQLQELLQGLASPAGSVPLIRFDGNWNSAQPLEFGEGEVADRLRVAVIAENQPVAMRYRVNNTPYLVVGIPLPDVDAAYFEATPLEQVESTLRSLGLALLGASVLTTVAGAALGIWAGRRVVSPLNDIGEAAELIASGALDTRLETETDRDLSRLTTSFNAMASALQTRIERDARFASEVSHELRSPLMTLTASVEVLESRRDEMPERAQTALDLLSSDIERFRQLVEDLLEISRFDAGAAALQPADIEIGEFVRQSIAASGAGIPVDAVEPVDGLVIQADKRRLHQVLVNLIQNAEKYGGGATGIHIQQLNGAVQIAVDDAGPGVPEAERDKIFDRFSRGSEGGRRGTGTGVGLGLALVAEHVALHGGRTWVEDVPHAQQGARFIIELPVEPL